MGIFPVYRIINAAARVIDNLHVSEAEKLQARNELASIEAELSSEITAAEREWARAQSRVIRAEAESQSWIARNWRPILMLVFTYIIAHNFVIAPLFSLPVVLVPEQMWDLLKVGVGGYIFGRTAEKVVPEVVKGLNNS